jgi:glycosyltransferase involved in cell wall biosynthesis
MLKAKVPLREQKRSMRFAFITTMLGAPWGGSEELWSQSAILLKRSGHEVCALVPHRPRLSEKVQRLAQQGIKVRTYPAPSFLAGPVRYYYDKLSLSTRRTYSWLKQFSPDLVMISQGEIVGGLDWARACRVASIPYAIILHWNSESSWFDRNEIDDAVASYTAARNVFCVSRSNLSLLRLQLGESLANAELVWNPYNVSTEVVPVWPDDNDPWRIACVGRLDPSAKGQDILLQAMALTHWRKRPIEVSFFGEGPYEPALRRMASMLQLKNIQFRGHVNDVMAIWSQHHLLALPSRSEGLPLVLVESMWCGRPAVVTDVAGNAELCEDGETGFVAQSATLSSFAEALERAWAARTKWKKMGEAARARAETLIPVDPIGIFCERLRACASGKSDPVSTAPGKGC